MRRRALQIQSSNLGLFQAAWYGGMDQAMSTLGTAPQFDAKHLAKAQNQAIKDCWRMTGIYLRDAMLEFSSSTGIHPE